MDPAHEAYATVVAFLFGDGAPEHVLKADVREKRQAKVALAGNVLGLTAGTAALAASSKNPALRKKTALGHAGPVTGRLVRYLKTPKGKARLIQAGAAAAVGLQAANLAGDAVGNIVLRRENKRVSKSSPDGADLHVVGGDKPKRRAPLTTGRLTLVAAEKSAPYVVAGTKASAKGAVKGGKYARDIAVEKTPVVLDKTRKFTEKVTKSDELDVTWSGEFSKFDTDKRQVFGWASIVEVNGEPVVDLQGDYITPDEIEKAAYDYVVKSRKGGDMHKRDGEAPLHVSDMIESFVVTEEKKKLLNLPDSTPSGWWVGFAVNDDDIWAKVKSGERRGFSIHGSGKRKTVEGQLT